MNYKIEDKKSQVLITIEINAEEWESALEKAYQSTKGEYSHTGFRKGHVPRKVIESVYGATVFFEDGLNEAFSKYYFEILDKEVEIYPVDRPEVDITSIDEKGVKLTALVTVKPKVKLGEYKGLNIKRKPIKVTEKEVNDEIAQHAEKSSRMVAVTDRDVMNDDETTIDFSGSVDGVKFDGGSSTGYKLVVGSQSFIPGFEEQMIGMKLSETKNIVVMFPENYHAENLKGKEAVFEVTVHEIRTKQLPKIDDEFAKDASKFESLKDWKADIKKNLTKSNADKEEMTLENDIIEKVVKNAKVDIPDAMIETQIDSYISEFETTLTQQGMKLDDYIKYAGTTLSEMRDVYREKAGEIVKTRLVMEEVIKTEKILPDQKDVENRVKELAESSGQTVEQFKKTLTQGHVNYIMNETVSKKLIEFLKKENSIA